MSAPLVSVCLPNLNTRPYLPERIGTIRAQTYTNWELVVSDNHSDDGAWELFERVAAEDGRLSIAQAPREGMYPNWNRCIARARGEYVYIATSDDTMPPNCLEALVAALEARPECDVAHCPLRPIDTEGRVVGAKLRWWRQSSPFGRSSGALIDRWHVRRAPFDGLLYLLGASVYISLTQLLIRRSLFDRIGLFEAGWGSAGDFNWSMRAALVASTVHVPSTWGGWRLHPTQATAAIRMDSAEHACRVDAMIEDAVERSAPFVAPEVRRRLTTDWNLRARAIREYKREVAGVTRAVPRNLRILRKLLAGSAPAREHLGLSLRGRALTDWARDRAEEAGIVPFSALESAGAVPRTEGAGLPAATA